MKLYTYKLFISLGEMMVFLYFFILYQEVNELVQKVSGTDQPVPLWVDEIETNNPTSQPMLYSLLFRYKVSLCLC